MVITCIILLKKRVGNIIVQGATKHFCLFMYVNNNNKRMYLHI